MDPSDTVLSLVVSSDRDEGGDLSSAVLNNIDLDESLSHEGLARLSSVAALLITDVRQQSCVYCLAQPAALPRIVEHTERLLNSIQKLLHAAGQYARFCPPDVVVPQLRDANSDPLLHALQSLKEDTVDEGFNGFRDRCKQELESATGRYTEMLGTYNENYGALKGSLRRIVVQDGEIIDFNDGEIILHVSSSDAEKVSRVEDPVRRLFQRDEYKKQIEVLSSEVSMNEVSGVLQLLYPESRIFSRVESTEAVIRIGEEMVPGSSVIDRSRYNKEVEMIFDHEQSLDNTYGQLIDQCIEEMGIGFLRDAKGPDALIQERRDLHRMAEDAYLGLLVSDGKPYEDYDKKYKSCLNEHQETLEKGGQRLTTRVYEAGEDIEDGVLDACVQFCQGYEVRPGDPRYTRLGGTMFKKDRASLEQTLIDGAQLICCSKAEEGALKGFLIVYPPDTHQAIGAHIGKQEHWYGPSSYVSFVAVSQDVSASVYSMVMARMMMQSYTSSIYAGQVAIGNVPSLLTNGFATGGIVNVAHTKTAVSNLAYQGYNDLVDLYCGDNYVRLGLGENVAEEHKEEAEFRMVGFLRALDSSWKQAFQATTPDRREAMMEVRYLQTASLPGICEPTMDSLLRVWRFSQQEELRRSSGFGSTLSDQSVKSILEIQDQEKRVLMIARMRTEARLLLRENYVDELEAMGYWSSLQEGELSHEQRLRAESIFRKEKAKRWDQAFSETIDVYSWQDLVLEYLGDLSTDRTRTEMDLHFGDWPMLTNLKDQLEANVTTDSVRELLKKAALKLPIR